MKNLLLKYGERPLKAGDVIDHRYTIQKVLGKGSYGITYLALTKRDEPLVLKQLRAYKAASDSGLSSFRLEKELLEQLSSPYFPAYSGSFIWNSKHFIAMEYISGDTFEDLIFLKKESFGEKESFRILLKVIEAVEVLHAKGIVHRDLRIPNILLKHESIRIIDFGLAARIGEGPDPAELGKSFSREKRHYRERSFQSDFYALGHFVLFLLYSQYVPVSKKNRSWEEELALTQHSKDTIKRMLKLQQPYDRIEDLKADVLKCADRGEENVVF